MKEINNCLTLDLDFMFPCPQYHEYITSDFEPEKSWKLLKLAYEKEIKIDQRAYQFVKEILGKIHKDTVIKLIDEHDEMIGVLNGFKTEDIDLFNVDYHHDVRYSPNVKDLDIENWVTYARHQGLALNYRWITQDDAELCQFSTFSFSTHSYKDISIEKLDNFDLIVICISKHFTPPEYWNLGEQLLNECEKHKEELTWEDVSAEHLEERSETLKDLVQE